MWGNRFRDIFSSFPQILRRGYKWFVNNNNEVSKSNTAEDKQYTSISLFRSMPSVIYPFSLINLSVYYSFPIWSWNFLISNLYPSGSSVEKKKTLSHEACKPTSMLIFSLEIKVKKFQNISSNNLRVTLRNLQNFVHLFILG